MAGSSSPRAMGPNRRSPYASASSPTWLLVTTAVVLGLAVTGCLLALIPNKRAKSLPRVLQHFRRWWRDGCWRLLELSMKGPLAKLLVLLGRKGSLGRLASRCQTPTVFRTKVVSCTEAHVSFEPCLPMNVFHEEQYVLSWRKVGDEWQERLLSKEHRCEVPQGSKKLKYLVKGLPDGATIECRVSSFNAHGKSPWTEEAKITTLREPSEGGGAWGPLQECEEVKGEGSCSSEVRQGSYSWGQTKSEVSFRIPVSKARKAKDVAIKALPTKIELKLKASEDLPEVLLLSGPLPKRIQSDEVYWSIEEDEELGRHLAILMTKAEEMEKWPCLIDSPAHPKIDTSLLHFKGNGIAGLDIWE